MAAKKAGLEVSFREAPKGSGHYFTDISLPNVGKEEIEKATAAFNRFAELYKKGSSSNLGGMELSKEQLQYAEVLWQTTKEDADRGDVGGVYLRALLEKYYPGNREKQIRLMGFMNEVSEKYRGRIPRETAWELGRKWDVESMLTKELLEFMPPESSNPRREVDMDELKAKQIAEEAAVKAAELTGSKIAQQVAKELSGEVLHESPVSPHCEAVLAKPPLCWDFRGIRSYVLCKAWDIMEKERRVRLPVGEAWSEARRVCVRE